jgi:hypothetical protein
MVNACGIVDLNNNNRSRASAVINFSHFSSLSTSQAIGYLTDTFEK